MSRKFRITPVASVLVLAACVSSGASERDSGSTVLTRTEIDAVDVATLYEVVQRLRPRWLNVRADRSLYSATTAIVVYQGQTQLGGIDVLRELGPESVESLRYLDGPRASATLPGLGSEQVEGAIIIQVSSD